MKTSRVVLLGFTVPDELSRELFQSDPIPAVQTHKFAWAFASTLAKVYDKVFLMSAPPVQTYPITPFRRFPSQEFERNGLQGTILGASNVRFLRHFSRFLACLKMTGRLRREWRPDVVFVHGVHTPFLLYASFLRLLGIKAIAIVTDAPGVILASDSNFRGILKMIDRGVVKLLLRSMNGVVALAPALAEKLAPGKPALIIPGIISDTWLKQIAAYQRSVTSRRLTVTYAGGIEEKYGIRLLLATAALSPEIIFRVCGTGGYFNEARLVATENIMLPGFLDQKEVANELMGADVLINPRPSNSDFATMSFPSKLLEYLATGTPVLTTRISSIPEELRECFYYIDEETPERMAAAIGEIADISRETRLDFGASATRQAVDRFGEDAIGHKLLAFLAHLR